MMGRLKHTISIFVKKTKGLLEFRDLLLGEYISHVWGKMEAKRSKQAKVKKS